MLLLRARSDDLAAAGLDVVAISLDSPFSHRAWAESLDLPESLELVSDSLGEVTRAFGVASDFQGIPKAERSIFLLRGGTVVATWMLARDMPDLDEVIAVASSSAP